jgi:hypothetical protein
MFEYVYFFWGGNVECLSTSCKHSYRLRASITRFLVHAKVKSKWKPESPIRTSSAM